MRIFNFDSVKPSKKYIIAYILAIMLGIMSGIVLFNLSSISAYLYDFADNYVYYIFNFNNSTLFFSHLLVELFYLYILFLLCAFTKLKFLTIPILFLRTLLASLYAAILFALFATEGLFIALVVYIPTYLVSAFLMVFICECFKIVCRPYSFFTPLALAVCSSLIFLLLTNTLFRFIIVIA